jgi:hypothetical protein
MGGMGGMGGGLFGFGGGVKDDDGLLMRDDKLAALGKAIRLVEADVKKSEEDDAKTWATTTKPKLEKVAIGRGMFVFYAAISRPLSLFSSGGPQQIAELEKKCAALRNRIDVEGPRKGLEHVATLEDELRPLNESLEGAKKRFCCRTARWCWVKAGCTPASTTCGWSKRPGNWPWRWCRTRTRHASK